MAEKKRPGRPKGSTNKRRADAVAVPAACPACGSTNLKRIPGYPVRVFDYAGEHNGVTYDQVTWADHVCGCGQQVRVRSYRKT